MTNDWRTTTVCQLCQTIRGSADHTLLPILADALQDAGCDDEPLLAELRSPDYGPEAAERLVALVYSDETAAAVRWVEAFVRTLGAGGDPGDLPELTYDRLMAAAREYATGANPEPFGRGSLHWSNESDGREPEFWAHYQAITGGKIGFEVPEWGTEFFTCRC